MNIIEVIKEYQALVGTLLGSFLAILSSVFLWYLKERYEKRKQFKNNKNEIKDIFLMAARESQEAVRDLEDYIFKVRDNIKNTVTAGKMHIFNPPRFNRIHINEERLFLLKQGLDFVMSQQIDIAMSSAKKLNGYLDNFEYAPSFIFEGTIKLINSSIVPKEIAIEDYAKDQERHLKNIEFMLKNDIEQSQRNILRPIVAQTHKDLEKLTETQGIDIDTILNSEADLLLATIKME